MLLLRDNTVDYSESPDRILASLGTHQGSLCVTSVLYKLTFLKLMHVLFEPSYTNL